VIYLEGGSFMGTTDVDDFIIEVAASVIVHDGLLNLYGGDISKPSIRSAGAIATLESKGWTVLTN
jgi:hypothetical protein